MRLVVQQHSPPVFAGLPTSDDVAIHAFNSDPKPAHHLEADHSARCGRASNVSHAWTRPLDRVMPLKFIYAHS